MLVGRHNREVIFAGLGGRRREATASVHDELHVRGVVRVHPAKLQLVLSLGERRKIRRLRELLSGALDSCGGGSRGELLDCGESKSVKL